MLNLLSGMSQEDLVSNYKKILRGIVNAQIDTLKGEEKQALKIEIVKIFEKLSTAVKESSLPFDNLVAVLSFPYPEWFTLHCSSTLFELLYELLIKERKPTVQELLTFLPNIANLYLFNKLLEFQTLDIRIEDIEKGGGIEEEEYIDYIQESHKLRTVQNILGDKDIPDDLFSTQKSAKNAAENENSVEKLQKIDENSEQKENSIKLGYIDAGKSAFVLEKRFQVLCDGFHELVRSDVDLALGFMKSTKVFDSRLLDYVALYVFTNFAKLNQDSILRYIDVAYRAKRNFPFHIYYMFRDRFFTRISSMSPRQQLSTFRLLTKQKLYHHDTFMIEIIENILANVEKGNFKHYDLPVLQYFMYRSSYAKSGYAARIVLQYLPALHLGSLMDIKLILMGMARETDSSTVNRVISSLQPILDKMGAKKGGEIEMIIRVYNELVKKHGGSGKIIAGESETRGAGASQFPLPTKSHIKLSVDSPYKGEDVRIVVNSGSEERREGESGGNVIGERVPVESLDYLNKQISEASKIRSSKKSRTKLTEAEDKPKRKRSTSKSSSKPEVNSNPDEETTPKKKRGRPKKSEVKADEEETQNSEVKKAKRVRKAAKTNEQTDGEVKKTRTRRTSKTPEAEHPK